MSGLFYIIDDLFTMHKNNRYHFGEFDTGYLFMILISSLLTTNNFQNLLDIFFDRRIIMTIKLIKA